MFQWRPVLSAEVQHRRNETDRQVAKVQVLLGESRNILQYLKLFPSLPLLPFIWLVCLECKLTWVRGELVTLSVKQTLSNYCNEAKKLMGLEVRVLIIFYMYDIHMTFKSQAFRSKKYNICEEKTRVKTKSTVFKFHVCVVKLIFSQVKKHFLFRCSGIFLIIPSAFLGIFMQQVLSLLKTFWQQLSSLLSEHFHC